MPGPEARIRERFRKALPSEWLRIAFAASAYSGPGRSDDLVLAAGKFVAVEWKAEGNTPTPKQVEFIEQVRAAGGYGFVARQASEAIRAIWMITQGAMPYREDSVDLDFLFGDTPPPVAEDEDAAAQDARATTVEFGDDLLAGVNFTEGPAVEFSPTPDFSEFASLQPTATAAPEAPARQRRARRRRDADEVLNGIERVVADAPVEDPPRIVEMPRPVRTLPSADGQAPNLLDAVIEMTAAIRELTFEMSALRSEIAAMQSGD